MFKEILILLKSLGFFQVKLAVIWFFEQKGSTTELLLSHKAHTASLLYVDWFLIIEITVNFDSLMSEPLSVFSLRYNYQFNYIYPLLCNQNINKRWFICSLNMSFICSAIKLISSIFNHGCVYSPDQTFIHNSWFIGENWINLKS